MHEIHVLYAFYFWIKLTNLYVFRNADLILWFMLFTWVIYWENTEKVQKNLPEKNSFGTFTFIVGNYYYLKFPVLFQNAAVRNML